MNILIAGGTGFLGSRLTDRLLAAGHTVRILVRKAAPGRGSAAVPVSWDELQNAGSSGALGDTDAVINVAGESVARWPWTMAARHHFLTSRLNPGRVLAAAIAREPRRPRVFIQGSGINHYGLEGDMADEGTPPGTDFLAQLTLPWEESSRKVEESGVRRAIIRSAVVLDRRAGMLPLMALPVRLFAGGPIAGGQQAMPWIHIEDWVRAVQFLIEDESASGPFNLVSPEPTSNADFYRALARTLHRPFWIPIPGWPLRLLLGGMSVLLLRGRFAAPARLLQRGFQFRFGSLAQALADLYE